jgi:histidinol-phosphate aminotransferase
MTRSLHELIPDYIRGLDPYVPGKPVEEVERELKITAIKLASNENPLGPSPRAVEAVRAAVAASHRYPDGGGYYLREKLCARLGVPMENIFLGDGSSELIDLVARLLLRPGDEGLTSDGTFPLYWIAIRAAGAKLVRVPLRDFSFDLEALVRAVTPRTRIIYLANPNNPTGTVFSRREFDDFYRRVSDSSDAMVVLDEAYCDYAGQEDYPEALQQAARTPNLLVLRTFSKIYGLAGIRMGYGIGPAELFVEMNKLRTPFNTSNIAQAAAIAALDDHEHVQRSRQSNCLGLAALSSGLSAMGASFVPSHANFVLIDTGRDARQVADALLRLGVIVRPLAWMGLPACIRVSVGTPEENERFLAAFEQIRAMAAR